jgi:hypothetical protein
MGERNWYDRYRHSRDYADEQARLYARGEEISHWRYQWDHKPGAPTPPTETLTGAAWVAWTYTIAAEEASSLVHVQGKQWQSEVDECARLAQEYQEMAGTSHA